jgi:outer membrane biosynthesis protein TonB
VISSDNLPMKSSWVRGLLIFSLFFSLALKQNDVVELEQYFNARYSANFLKTTKNVKFVIPPGTQGKIEEIKKFDSGNSGLHVTLQSGKNKGEKVWVYYKESNPGMKLFEGDAEKSAATSFVEDAKSAVTTEATTAWRTPAGEPIPLVVTKEYAEELMKKLDTVQEKIKVVETKNQKPCDDDCKLAQQTYMSDLPKPEEKPKEKEIVKEKPQTKPEPIRAAGVREEAKPVEKKEFRENLAPASKFQATTSQDPPVLRPIPNTENRKGITYPVCRPQDGDYYSCAEKGQAEEKFSFANRGPNRVVPAGSRERNREWEFRFPGQARQDMSFAVSDAPNGTISATQENMFLLFPRNTMPHIRTEGNKQVVTLPTGETVTFNTRTKEIVSGVLSEDGPMATGGGFKNLSKISYGGKGVMIRAVAGGTDPRLAAKSVSTAVVTKQGKSCEVLKKDLWDQRGNSAVHFKYFSDKDFDTYLQRRCGFGLY